MCIIDPDLQSAHYLYPPLEGARPPYHRVRVLLKYRHCDGSLRIKVTDDVVCLLYSTDQAQDVKKIEKFHSQLMRLMVARESRSTTMETD
ncbi:signal recognition particle 9 kDa protein isoform X2 [Engystomops pustulosus]|uniref:signal recognition particle 9 kDa protein isoform X2 n=1 Tax=Engystomops pustulosus TaxID=76066 RepID=UPI003AFACCE1